MTDFDDVWNLPQSEAPGHSDPHPDPGAVSLLQSQLQRALLADELGEALALLRRLGRGCHDVLRRLGLNEDGNALEPLAERHALAVAGAVQLTRNEVEELVATGQLPSLVSACNSAQLGSLLHMLLDALCDVDALLLAEVEALAHPLRDALAPLTVNTVAEAVRCCKSLSSTANGALLVACITRGRSDVDRGLITEAVHVNLVDYDEPDCVGDADDDDDAVVEGGELHAVASETDVAAASTTSAAPPASLGEQCCGCHLFKRSKEYSRNQMAHHARGARRCRTCASHVAPTLLPCHNCHRLLARSFYSATQFRRGAKKRCGACAGGEYCAAFLSPRGCTLGAACPRVHSLQPEQNSAAWGEGGAFASGDGL